MSLNTDVRMRYLGVLKILEEASPYVPQEVREMIEDAFADACKYDDTLVTYAQLNRRCIEVKLK